MQIANDRTWERRTANWIAMQEKSKKIKEEADRLELHGSARRRFFQTQKNKEKAKERS
ncbi:hypothetical protein [Saccharophagus sp. K07]|uniref:hypothetical protein n=1 Tax=Saccharophagus sp. K07 TaxID=2283636 RepID=UPI001651D2B2|nr:hypothetical protein [Saccharophagus sp. K07]